MEDGNILESFAPDSGAENTGGDVNNIPDSSSNNNDNAVVESVPDISEAVPESEADSSEGDSDPVEDSSESVTAEESQSQVDGETVQESVTETETEMETETEKEAIEDILKDIQNTLSGNSVGETSGTADGEAVSGNSVQESVSGNDYVSVDYTEGLQSIQDSLNGLQATVTCIFIAICLYFVRQAAKHFIKGFMGGRDNG